MYRQHIWLALRNRGSAEREKECVYWLRIFSFFYWGNQRGTEKVNSWCIWKRGKKGKLVFKKEDNWRISTRY